MFGSFSLDRFEDHDGRYSLRRNHLAIAARIAIPVMLFTSGCHKKTGVAVVPTPVKPVAPAMVSEIDLKSYKPNETGAVMILMYHHFRTTTRKGPAKDDPLNRLPETFRKDLEDLYKRKYYPVTVQEFVENKMDVPVGKTPIMLTFDDAAPTQFKTVGGTDGSSHIDPDCSVGIMETFNKAHKDWPTKATFFVLPKEGKRGAEPFGQAESVAEKFQYLISHGYEIANHTSTHPSMRGASADKIQWEIATALKDIKAINTAAQMKTLALPYGSLPGKANRDLLKRGESGGTKYENEAVLLAAWRPVLSPITVKSKKFTQAGKLAEYDPYHLERITPDPTHPNQQTFEFWLKFFDENPSLKYISGGNPKVFAVPKSLATMVDPERVKASGKTLQLYSFSASKSNGSSLSVQ